MAPPANTAPPSAAAQAELKWQAVATGFQKQTQEWRQKHMAAVAEINKLQQELKAANARSDAAVARADSKSPNPFVVPEPMKDEWFEVPRSCFRMYSGTDLCFLLAVLRQQADGQQVHRQRTGWAGEGSSSP